MPKHSRRHYNRSIEMMCISHKHLHLSYHLGLSVLEICIILIIPSPYDLKLPCLPSSCFGCSGEDFPLVSVYIIIFVYGNCVVVYVRSSVKITLYYYFSPVSWKEKISSKRSNFFFGFVTVSFIGFQILCQCRYLFFCRKYLFWVWSIRYLHCCCWLGQWNWKFYPSQKLLIRR